MGTIKFYTLGCKVNQYETQLIREQFIQAGFKELGDGQPADLYIINTCTVTHRADSASLNFIRRAKRENPKAKIIVTGCLAELDADKIKNACALSLIVKNKDKANICKDLSSFNSPTHEVTNSQTINGISYFKGRTRAFLKIQDGCDNFCSYCKVPLVRGRSRSKPVDEIVEEAKNLVKNGFKEIVLCGICLGAYGKDLNHQISLVDVIGALEKLAGLLRIRLSSIEAADVSDGLIDKMAESKNLCRHLHIPIQSGDGEILKKMNRRYCRDDYLNLIQRIKSLIPEIAITTDVLVGFPTETENNFQNTVGLIEEILPLKVHIFPYSRREGTPAASSFKDEISPIIIKERIQRLKNLSHSCATLYKKEFLNKDMDVLIEERLKDNPDFWEGYTDNYIRVLVKSSHNLKNQLINVSLKKIVKDSVLADLY